LCADAADDCAVAVAVAVAVQDGFQVRASAVWWAVKVASDGYFVFNLDATGLPDVGSSIVREKSSTPMHFMDKR